MRVLEYEILEEVLMDLEEVESLEEARELIQSKIDSLKILEYAEETFQEQQQEEEKLDEFEQQDLRTFNPDDKDEE